MLPRCEYDGLIFIPFFLDNARTINEFRTRHIAVDIMVCFSNISHADVDVSVDRAILFNKAMREEPLIGFLEIEDTSRRTMVGTLPPVVYQSRVIAALDRKSVV